MDILILNLLILENRWHTILARSECQKYRDKNLQTREFVDDFIAFVKENFESDKATDILQKIDFII